MIAIIESAEHPVILEGRRQSPRIRHMFVVANRAHATIRAMSQTLQRRFAAFAGVPYHEPLDMEQWEQLWETEPSMSHERHSPSE
jgi:hypothetical protein